MLGVVQLLVCLFVNSVTSNLNYFHHPVKSCRIGDVVQNDCNKCLCTSKTVFECTPMDCNKTMIEETNTEDVKQCIPNQLYIQNLITCICTKDGRWPHQSCEETFKSLPQSNVVEHKCDPNTYVVIDCNVCRCGPDGEFISNKCTKNTCDTDVSRRHHKASGDKKSSVYSSCETKTWYSLAPCQFCYCVHENKLVCNTGNDHSKKLELGTYDMQICGTEMIREAMELIPNSQKTLRDGADRHIDVETEAPRVISTIRTISKKNNENIEIKISAEDVRINNDTDQSIQNVQENTNDVQDVEESESDLEEVKAVSKITTTIAPIVKPVIDNTLTPAVEISDENENSNSDEDNSKYNSNEIDAEQLTIPDPTGVKKRLDHNSNKNPIRRTKMGKTTEKVGETIQINLPDVLNNMFSMALRKSMVTLDKEIECTPGTTSADGCNMCFCLKNGKRLCTSRNC